MDQTRHPHMWQAAREKYPSEDITKKIKPFTDNI
jgi:hypothetical protein